MFKRSVNRSIFTFFEAISQAEVVDVLVRWRNLYLVPLVIFRLIRFLAALRAFSIASLVALQFIPLLRWPRLEVSVM